VTDATRAVLFNAVPLLLLAGAYATVAGGAGSALWRARERADAREWTTALVFPAIAVAAAILGIVVIPCGSLRPRRRC